MGYRLIISVSILSLLLTACFGAADGPDAAAGADGAAGIVCAPTDRQRLVNAG